MRNYLIPALCLAFAGAGSLSPASAAPAQPIDNNIVHIQVLLDRLGFSPSVIDGRKGAMLTRALKGLQQARELPVTGTLDDATNSYLSRFARTPATIAVTLTAADIAGPYQGPIPTEPAAQAKLAALGYSNLLERLSERFHTTPATLIALNPPGTPVRAGVKIRVPNVRPVSRDYPADLRPDWKATLADLNVDARQPEAARIVVDKSDGVLRVYDKGGALVAQFPATMGSKHDPLPIGKWKIQGESYLPKFHYNPKLFWDASSKDGKQVLPAGPNGPVGVIWLDLNKPHYGIHGTPNPETIGRAESHGCIRLTNWDAARLSLMVKPGTPAVFQK